MTSRSDRGGGLGAEPSHRCRRQATGTVIQEYTKRIFSNMSSKLDVVLGLQWGDEGKGKIVDVLAGRYPAVARFQGGPNAGHSLHFDEIGRAHV